MLKKILSMLLVLLLINLAVTPTTFAGESKETKFIEKVRLNIQKLGTGNDAQIEVKLKDSTKLKGYIRESNNDQFVVIDKNTGQATTVLYPQVRTIRGNNLSSHVIVAIGFAIFLVVLVALVAADKS